MSFYLIPFNQTQSIASAANQISIVRNNISSSSSGVVLLHLSGCRPQRGVSCALYTGPKVGQTGPGGQQGSKVCKGIGLVDPAQFLIIGNMNSRGFLNALTPVMELVDGSEKFGEKSVKLLKHILIKFVNSFYALQQNDPDDDNDAEGDATTI